MSLLPLGDSEIRRALKKYLSAAHRSDPELFLVEELGICQGRARADVTLLTRRMHAYEIKSDRDSLRRLIGQIDFYGRCFDEVTVVVGERHLDNISVAVPSWWGVLKASRIGTECGLVSIRDPQPNPGRDPRALAEFLWLSEALMLLAEHGIDRGVRSKPRRYIWDRISECLDVDTIACAVRERIRARTTEKAAEPRSLCDELFPIVSTPQASPV